MYKWLLLSALVALVAGECSNLQRLKVKAKWAEVFGNSEEREELSRKVWEIIFEAHPEYKDQFFQRVNGHDMFSPEFKAHAARVMSGFDIGISLLTDEAVLNANLAHLKEQHIKLSIPAEAFQAFKVALMKVVSDDVGYCFDTDAWAGCLDVLLNGISA